MDKLLSERFEQELDGVLNCYDRVVITGNLQTICYAQGMTRYLYQKGIRIFDYANLRNHFGNASVRMPKSWRRRMG